METPYTKDYYRALREGARRSAEAVVPLVMGLLHPRSVVDVGCGDGTWLSVFLKEGVRDILGIDREYVSGDILEIPRENFVAHDLRVPLETDRAFDLVVSLEVAEHLPGESAETFVESLARLGPAILFSAAPPFQGGTDHVNEQWPEYWVGIFGRKGFVALDPVRKHVWGLTGVEYWYRQNTLLFVQRDYLENRPELAVERECARGPLSIVHPEMFLEMERKCSFALRELEASLAEAEALRGETAGHRAKAERFFAEIEERKAEAAEHRAKTEHYIAGSERYREEAAAQRAKADHYFAEAREFREKAEPENMSLKEVLKALPAILAGAIGRAVKRRSGP
ncbi:MAG: methyltransferase domain-containing protein [Deltaproteobacteria bacterium]|nr:methyltransferase domain-containing protein [Deltaproteobacteria bacterium]